MHTHAQKVSHGHTPIHMINHMCRAMHSVVCRYAVLEGDYALKMTVNQTKKHVSVNTLLALMCLNACSNH